MINVGLRLGLGSVLELGLGFGFVDGLGLWLRIVVYKLLEKVK